jgi:cytidylate kinase
MKTTLDYDQCLNFLNCEIKPPTRSVSPTTKHFRAVTLSRATGCGAYAVAEQLAALLTQQDRNAPCPWTVFDGNLIEKVLEDHHQPARLAKYFPEDRLTQVQDIMDELFDVRPPSWTIVEQTSETILKLAALGNVILIDRGGNLVTRSLPEVLHVRLMGSLEHRVRRFAETRGMTPASAMTYIQKTDLGRRRYLRQHFGAEIDDPLLYDLVLNTDHLSLEAVAKLIAHAVKSGR